jgi:hypothetical protein
VGGLFQPVGGELIAFLLRCGVIVEGARLADLGRDGAPLGVVLRAVGDIAIADFLAGPNVTGRLVVSMTSPEGPTFQAWRTDVLSSPPTRMTRMPLLADDARGRGKVRCTPAMRA